MTDDTTATVVSDAGSAISAASSSEVATPAPGSEGTQTSSDDQAAIAATEVAAAKPATTDPPEAATPGLEDILNSIPENDDDLNDPNIRDVEARRNMRSQLRVLSEAIKPLRTLEPLADLAQYGEPETIKGRLDAYNSLFEQVVDPATQQPQFDQSGLPKVSASKFIEQVDAENPGLAETMLNDLLRYAPELPNGQKVSFYERALREVYGLDPKRLDDYRKIDALTAPTGEVISEQLEKIDPKFHEVYKTLPSAIRNDLDVQDEETRQFNLNKYQKDFDRERSDAQVAQQQQVEQQSQLAQARERIAQEQESFVSSQIQESYATIMDDLASKVTFSGDAAQNASTQCQIAALLNSLRDSDFRQANAQRLEAMGIKLSSDFDEALNAADKHLRDAKAYELMGQKGFAKNSLVAASAAKNQVLAKLAPIALRAAKAAGGVMATKANGQNQSLQSATNTRPTPGNGTQAEVGTFGVADMLPNDPRYGVALARQTGLLR